MPVEFFPGHNRFWIYGSEYDSSFRTDSKLEQYMLLRASFVKRLSKRSQV